MNNTVSSSVPGIICAPTAEALPHAGLLALAMTGFVAMVTEILPAGLLPQISEGLRVSDAMAGQLMTVFALGALLTAIPLAAVTRGWRRRPVLLLAIVGLIIFDTVTALLTSYALTLIARYRSQARRAVRRRHPLQIPEIACFAAPPKRSRPGRCGTTRAAHSCRQCL